MERAHVLKIECMRMRYVNVIVGARIYESNVSLLKRQSHERAMASAERDQGNPKSVVRTASHDKPYASVALGFFFCRVN